MKIEIRPTNNPSIVKFEFDEMIVRGQYEYKNVDETKNSPIAKQLFFLPFVKTVFISANFVAIERYNIVTWEDVQDAVAEQLEAYANAGEPFVIESATEGKKTPVTIYGETTPNPAVLKFVSNKLLTKHAVECKNIDETQASPLAKTLFEQFPFVREIFIDENYISITKYDSYNWDSITLEVRTFIKNYIENGGEIVNESALANTPKQEKQAITHFENLDTTSQQIVNILEEYVKPAVQADGGNILFDSYDENEKRVKVILQGACSGCPSSTFTLKNGIENMLKDMLKNPELVVEAINM